MGNDFKFLKGNIETIILNALYNGDKYGYEIAKEIKEKTENKYEIKQPTLYGYLKRLQEQDLVEFYWGEESHGGRRKYFRLTSHGKSTCEQYLSEWNFHKNILDSLIADQDETLPEYTPQENVLLGSKSTKKRKSRKDFKDESENQQLFAELMKLSQSSADELDVENDDSANYVQDTVPSEQICSENFEDQIEFFNDEQIFDQQDDYDFISEEVVSTRILQESDSIIDENIQIEQKSEIEIAQEESENEFSCKSTVSTEDFEQEIKQDFTVEETFEQTETPIIETQPIIERKAGDVAETEISHNFTFIEIEEPKAELPRIDNFEEKFVPANTHEDEEIYHNRKTEVLNILYSDSPVEDDFAVKTTPQPTIAEENEAEAQYKQILSSLLGDQIVNTDEKIAQIAPHVSSRREEFKSENLTMTEMADSLAKEGYRIRFYNTATSQYKAVPMLIKNKINCVTAWSTLVVFYALLGLSWLIFGNTANILAMCATAFAFLLIPSYFTYVYITKPNIKIKSTHDFSKSMLNKLLIFTLLSALIFAIDFVLIKIDLSNLADIMHKVVIPELVVSMIVVSELLYNVFLKQKSFYN